MVLLIHVLDVMNDIIIQASVNKIRYISKQIQARQLLEYCDMEWQLSPIIQMKVEIKYLSAVKSYFTWLHLI